MGTKKKELKEKKGGEGAWIRSRAGGLHFFRQIT